MLTINDLEDTTDDAETHNIETLQNRMHIVDGCFSFCFVSFLKLKQIQFSQETEKYLVEDKLLPVFQHGFLRSEENVELHASEI